VADEYTGAHRKPDGPATSETGAAGPATSGTGAAQPATSETDPDPDTEATPQPHPEPAGETESTKAADPEPQPTAAAEPTQAADPESPPAETAEPDKPAEPSKTTEPESQPAEAAEAEEPAAEEADSSEPAQPVAVPGQYSFLKRWVFVLMLIAVWIPAAAIGLGLFYWWYTSLHKTPAVFVVLIFVIVCTFGGMLLAMVEHKPMVSAVAIALVSAPFIAAAAAAPLYGAYYFEWIPRPTLG
jgi:hypothetical protein